MWISGEAPVATIPPRRVEKSHRLLKSEAMLHGFDVKFSAQVAFYSAALWLA